MDEKDNFYEMVLDVQNLFKLPLTYQMWTPENETFVRLYLRDFPLTDTRISVTKANLILKSLIRTLDYLDEEGMLYYVEEGTDIIFS